MGESELRNFHEIVEAGVQGGWHSFEQDLVALFKEGKVTEETAVTYSVNKTAIRRALDIAKKDIGTQDEGPSGYRLNHEVSHVKPKPAPAAGAPPPPLPAELALKK